MAGSVTEEASTAVTARDASVVGSEREFIPRILTVGCHKKSSLELNKIYIQRDSNVAKTRSGRTALQAFRWLKCF